jgi:hypothetical protein
LVAGIVGGGIIFVATNWLIIKGGPISDEGDPIIGPHLHLLSQFFLGYEISFLGSLIGFVYGFIVGFLIGFFIAQVYNWIVDWKEKRQAA